MQRRNPFPTLAHRLTMKNSWQAVTNARAFGERKRAGKPRHKAPKPPKRKRKVIDRFYSSEEWKRLRYKVPTLHGARCQCCGATPQDGAVMNVDHIKPRKRYPALALEITNLQVLCAWCNQGKGAIDQTDWRQW